MIKLDSTESHHAKNVLRLRNGEHVRVLNGKGLEIEGLLEFKSGQNASVNVLSARYLDKLTKTCILGFVATENRDTDALIIRSAVEIGVAEIYVLISQYTGYRQSGNKNKFMERRYKIMVGACKQSGQLWLPKIAGPMKLEEFFDDLQDSVPAFVGWEPDLGMMEKAQPPLQAPSDGFAWIVGPEGGWSPLDISVLEKRGVTFMSLGSSTLTSPVAAIAGLTALKICFEDWLPFYNERRIK